MFGFGKVLQWYGGPKDGDTPVAVLTSRVKSIPVLVATPIGTELAGTYVPEVKHLRIGREIKVMMAFVWYRSE